MRWFFTNVIAIFYTITGLKHDHESFKHYTSCHFIHSENKGFIKTIEAPHKRKLNCHRVRPLYSIFSYVRSSLSKRIDLDKGRSSLSWFHLSEKRFSQTGSVHHFRQTESVLTAIIRDTFSRVKSSRFVWLAAIFAEFRHFSLTAFPHCIC